MEITAMEVLYFLGSVAQLIAFFGLWHLLARPWKPRQRDREER